MKQLSVCVSAPHLPAFRNKVFLVYAKNLFVHQSTFRMVLLVMHSTSHCEGVELYLFFKQIIVLLLMYQMPFILLNAAMVTLNIKAFCMCFLKYKQQFCLIFIERQGIKIAGFFFLIRKV